MNKNKSIINIMNVPLLIVFVISGGLVSYNILKYGFFNVYHLNIIGIAVLVLLMILSGLLIVKNKAKIFNMIFLILVNVLMLFAYTNIRQVVGLFNKVNSNATVSEYTMSVVVPKDSSISNISQLKGNVLASVEQDKDNINKLVTNIKDTESVTLKTVETNSYIESYESLLNEEGQAMILNDAYTSFIEAKYSDFSQKTKKIYEYKITKKVELSTTKNSGESFNVYISGIDTYGDVSTVSRSDVNIIMTVNKKTGKILLTTTPRDSYVKIADGGNNQYDKLTHAGIYGVDSSVHTLENLYGTKIDYYARLNFTSFTKLIDLIGGIDVYNDQAFNSHIGHYDFEVGMQHLDSQKALAFVRERYSLSGGDNDRGKNQEKVITAIIKKLSSKEALSNYNQVIEELSKSIQTNMPLDTVVGLANEQLSANKDFVVSSQALKGQGQMGLSSYAMPGYNLYMMQVDNSSLTEVSTNIKDVLEGK